MKPNQETISAALRRQIEAQERQEEQHEQQLAEFYASNPSARRLTETPRQRAVLDNIVSALCDDLDKLDLRPQLEGFVAGWLVGSGQFERYADLFQIWLDTVKDADLDAPTPPAADEVASVLAAIAMEPARSKRKARRAN